MYHKIQQELQPKDANTFKSLIKLYETKNYKKGLKVSEALLKSVPNHGETMSLRAIFLYLTGKKEEGQGLAKKALDGNMKSDICWHIYGIIHRSERNYKEAVKCYKFALMINPSNIQILRDLAVLQIQIRDIEGHAETRYKLLKNKESLVINWVAYAVGEHLKGDYEQTIKLIDSIKKITVGDSLKKIEKSELLIYEAFVLFEAKEYEKCIEVLTTNTNDITDRYVKRELVIQSYLALGQNEKAQSLIDELIEMNPNNGRYHQLYFDVKKALSREQITEEGKNLLKTYPRSQTLKLTILRNCGISEFKKVFLEYIIPYFRKSQPSIFNEIIGFYKENRQEYVKLIGEVLLENLKSLEENKKFVGSEEIELPNVLLWNYMVYAQHLDRIGNSKEALEFINKAINHTPTLVELYLIKAKIYKHMYNYYEAYQQAEKARTMDQADRYLNNKCIKYVLRINRTQEAEALMRLFLRDAQDGNAHDLQTIWFEIAMANAHLRLKEKGAAMRQFKFIEKHFSDMYEDQFDFHTYCMRKYNLKTYIEMIRYQDQLCNSKFYINAAVPMIYALLKHQNVLKEKQEEEKKEEEIMKNMNSKEKKAYKRDKEKAQAKKMKEVEEKKKKDPFYEQRQKLDLDGVEYLEKLTEPLEEANNFAEKIINVDITQPRLADSAYSALIDLQIARNKPLIVLKMLNKLKKFGQDKANTHTKTVRVLQYLQNLVNEKSIEGEVLESVQEEIKNLSSGKDIETLNSEFLKTIENKTESALIGERIALELQQIDNDKFAENLEKIAIENISSLSLQQAVQIYDQLMRIQQSVKQEFKEKLQKQFPESDYFDEYKNISLEQLQKEKEQKQNA